MGLKDKCLLAVDVGNTHTVLGVYKGGEIVADWRIASDHKRTADEVGVTLAGLFSFSSIDIADVEGVSMASVVPPLTGVYAEAIGKYLGKRVLLVGPGVRTGMEIKCDNPREVGADRIVNAVAAYAKYSKSLIVIDFGTATTLDYVDPEGVFCGGMIVPGVGIGMDALFDRASKLPKVALARPPAVLATNTVHAIQSGTWYGYVSMVDGLVTRIKNETGGDPLVVATGGVASLIAQETVTINHVEEFLTLDGLRVIYEKNGN